MNTNLIYYYIFHNLQDLTRDNEQDDRTQEELGPEVNETSSISQQEAEVVVHLPNEEDEINTIDKVKYYQMHRNLHSNYFILTIHFMQLTIPYTFLFFQDNVHGTEADTTITVVLDEVNQGEEEPDLKDKEQVVIPIDPGDTPKEIYIQVRVN